MFGVSSRLLSQTTDKGFHGFEIWAFGNDHDLVKSMEGFGVRILQLAVTFVG